MLVTMVCAYDFVTAQKHVCRTGNTSIDADRCNNALFLNHSKNVLNILHSPWFIANHREVLLQTTYIITHTYGGVWLRDLDTRLFPGENDRDRERDLEPD